MRQPPRGAGRTASCLRATTEAEWATEVPTLEWIMSFRSLLVASVFALSGALFAQSQAGVFVTGVNGSIDVPYNAALNAPAAGVTVEAWVTYNEVLPSSLNRFPTIIRAKPSPGWSYFLRVNAGTTALRRLRFAVNAAGAGIITVDWDFAPGQLACLTHVAGSYDGAGTLRLFVNGNQVSSANYPTAGLIIDGGGTVGIGEGLKNATLHNEVWNGRLDQVRVWSFPMDAATVRSVMFTPLSAAIGLEGAWNLDGNFLDATTNMRNGAAFGTVNFTPATVPPSFEYQLNSSAASFDLNGASVRAFCNAPVTVALNQTATFTASSTLLGSPFDIAYTVPETSVAASAGGFTTPGAQIVNLNLLAPSLGFALGGLSPFTFPYSMPLALPIASPVPLTVAAQMVIIDPSSADGFTLSAVADFRAQ